MSFVYKVLPQTILDLGSLVRFSHTIFALPFALSMCFLLQREGLFSRGDFFWILLCLFTARTAAMTFNRIVDAAIDARNPRTAKRELPAGKVSYFAAYALLLFSTLLFAFSSWSLGVHCLYLVPAVLFVLFSYSLAKRFSANSHLILGLALSLAPGGVWYAATATWSLTPAWLMLAVAFWVAGFDILYSCQDEDFDRKEGLHSIPVRFGAFKAFRIAQLFHILCVLFLVAFGKVMSVGAFYYVGVSLFALILLTQYRLVKPDDLRNIDMAFFDRNASASLIFCIFVFLDSLLV